MCQVWGRNTAKKRACGPHGATASSWCQILPLKQSRTRKEKKKKKIEALIFLPLASQRIRWLRLPRKDLLPEAEWVPQAHSLLSVSRRLRLYLCCIIRQHQRNGREIGHHTSGHEGGGRFQVALFQHYSWQQQESRLIRLTHEYMHFMTAFGLRPGSRRKLWGPVF